MYKIFLLIFLLTMSLLAHSGRTDSSGGHYNRSTGTYHYHNGGYSKPIVKKSYSQKKMQCGQKTYCYEMRSCSEAMFYFQSCGLKRLDGDKDGIPCESLCR